MRCLLIPVLTLMPVLAFSDGVPEAADVAAGKAVYSQTCIACHGADGKGTIPGVPDFTDKNTPLTKSAAELMKNINEGFQSKGSFMAMPSKGGNPTLTEADVRAVLAYIRAEFGT